MTSPPLIFFADNLRTRQQAEAARADREYWAEKDRAKTHAPFDPQRELDPTPEEDREPTHAESCLQESDYIFSRIVRDLKAGKDISQIDYAPKRGGVAVIDRLFPVEGSLCK